MFALAHAVLSANPHNRRPWLVELPAPGEIVLHVDLDRRLPETDPFDRQITIGLGCFLETLAVAASAKGLAAEIEPFPEGAGAPRLDARPVARIRLTPGAAPDPLFAAVPHRRSVKEPYEPRLPAPYALAALTAAVPQARPETAPDRVAPLRDLGWRAHLTEMETPRTLRESADLMRFGRAQIEANPDGIDLGGPMPEALWRVGELTPEKVMDPASTAYAQGLSMYRAMFENTPAFVWLPGPATRAGEIAAGRAWTRLHLAATAQGLALHPVSQSLQEFPEMAGLFAEVHGLLGVDPAGGERVHMLGRLGYGPEVAASPRWPLETRIRTA